MPDNIISQFNRTYNQPIETYRLVQTISERDNIPSGVRWPGMMVYVVSESKTYELKGGTNNTDWTTFGGVEEAPEDGSSYVRKDGEWTLMQSGSTPEYGSFTPTIYPKSGGGSYSYTFANGVYSKIGRLLNFTIIFRGLNQTGTVNAPSVGNLPYESAENLSDFYFTVGLLEDANISGVGTLVPWMSSSSDYMSFKYITGNVPQNITFTNGDFVIYGSYLTD